MIVSVLIILLLIIGFLTIFHNSPINVKIKRRQLTYSWDEFENKLHKAANDISHNSKLPIIRPLSGMNKDEIINKAKKIGTYDISIKPYVDCCSYFVPIHPETKAKINKILAIDSKLDLAHEYQEALSNIEETIVNL